MRGDHIYSPLDIDLALIPPLSESRPALRAISSDNNTNIGQPCAYGMNLGKTMDKPFLPSIQVS